MSDDPDSSHSTASSTPRSWLGRLTQAFSSELRNRDQLIETLQSAQANGLIDADTLAMIEGAIAVSEKHVADVMVPHAQVVSLAIDADPADTLAMMVESGHSRFPVHGEDRDDILGVLLAKDLLRDWDSHSPLDIRKLLRPAVLVPASKRLNVLLKEFRDSRNHMAIVVDEYGGVAGLVTIEDVLEQIVGKIDDEYDDAPDASAHVSELADGRYLVDALTPIDVFNEHFSARLPDDEYDTLGGLVGARIGRLPEVGDEIVLDERFHLSVAQADGRRVHGFHLRVLADA
ncbi:MAG: transporter associated domain-containing protein [Lysobacteraceae bacterium]